MSTDITERSANPFAVTQRAQQQFGALANAETQRSIAEVQARMMIARANPRDPRRAMDLILEDCRRPTLAEDAVYEYSRGGSDIAGPSIRLAEAIACRWGNIASGIKEVARGEGYSECVAYAWDLETGFYDERQFQVRHWRDTKGGGYLLKDERDIYELVANMGQRRKRAVLQTVIPRDVFAVAVSECERTLKAEADTTPEGLKKLLAAFEPFGVTREQIEKRIQRRIDAITAAQVVGLKKVYASLRDGMSGPGDWFETTAEQDQQSRSAGDALRKAAGTRAGSTAKAKGDDEADLRAGMEGPAASVTVDHSTGEIRSNPSDERTPDAAAVTQERTGDAPAGEAPTIEDAIAFVKAGKYDDARAICPQGQGAVLEGMIKSHQQGATPAQQRTKQRRNVGGVE